MRILLLLIVLSGAIVAFWWISQQDPERERSHLQAQAKAVSARIGIQKMLENADHFGFSNIVISPTGRDDSVDFRAMATQQGTPRPAFGEVSASCKDTLEAAECWAITMLEIDGRPYPLTDRPDTSNASDAGSDAPDESTVTDISKKAEGSAIAETRDGSVGEQINTNLQAPQQTVEQANIAEPEPPTELESPTATHQVDRPRINARAGPSTSTAIVTTLDGGTQLAEIEQDNGWAQFLILDGPATGETAWIALSIVAPVTP